MPYLTLQNTYKHHTVFMTLTLTLCFRQAMHAAPMYIAETAPSQIRGMLISLKEFFIVLGMLVSSHYMTCPFPPLFLSLSDYLVIYLRFSFAAWLHCRQSLCRSGFWLALHVCHQYTIMSHHGNWDVLVTCFT